MMVNIPSLEENTGKPQLIHRKDEGQVLIQMPFEGLKGYLNYNKEAEDSFEILEA